MRNVAIVGVGLIGGSFGLALKAAGFHGQIIGVSSPASIEAALTRGAVDRGASLEAVVREADLIYLAQPIGRILSTLRQLDPWVKAEALVTDAGSTKHLIVKTARAHLRRCAFLGGHPMAGKESRGVEHADSNLFAGRPYCLTAESSEMLEIPAVQTFREWVRKIGAKEVILSPEEHDRMVALSSHLPQLAATALAACLSGEETLAGPGLIGATRLALSSYEIWRDILATNSNAITDALTQYVQRLEHLRDNLRTRAIEEEFKHASEVARRIREQAFPEG